MRIFFWSQYHFNLCIWWLLKRLSHTEQNYWMLIGWDRGHFFLITRALLVIKRAWLLDVDWLSTPALSWFSASNGFWKGISETHRFWVWSKQDYFILTWKRINMKTKRSLLVEKQKDFSTKNVLIRNLKNVKWGRLVLHEAQNYRTSWPPNWKLISLFCFKSPY